MLREANISSCGRYRYSLRRTWADLVDGDDAAHAVFVMLNPSTADDKRDDPTITRCIAFARAWGVSTLVVVNLFAWRATDPRELYARPKQQIVGVENDRHIVEACRSAQVAVAAWGAHGALLNRGEHVRRLVPNLKVLRLTKDGHPSHPLYLPKTLMPMSWTHP